MSAIAVLETKEAEAKQQKTASAAASQIPQSVFTKAMLEEMLAAKKTSTAEKTEQEKDSPVAGADVISTTIIYRAPSIAAINLLGIFGIKIDLNAQKDRFREEYMKNYAMSKSHNMLVSRFAAVKYGFYGMMLSFLGVSSEEILELQKNARDALISQNRVLMDENEYAGEMLEIMGGPKKRMRAERMVIDEMRKQLIAQLSNCGVKEYSDPDRLIEIQRKQCLSILQKLTEEKAALEYELSMTDMGLCQYGDGKDTPEKLQKLERYITKTKARIEKHDKKLEVFKRKSSVPDPFVCADDVKISKRARK